MSSGDPEPTDPVADDKLNELLAEFGERPSAPALDAAQLAGLEDIKASMITHMDDSQGRWRRRSALGRYWPFVLAALFGAGFIASTSKGMLNPVLIAAIICAGVTAVVCLSAVLLAPTHPGLSERVAVGGILLSLLGFGLELWGGVVLTGGSSEFHLSDTLKCSGTMTMMFVVPLGVLMYAMRRTGLPVRFLHAAALTTGALSLAAVSTWKACTPDDILHISLGHIAAPALFIPVVGLIAWRLTRRDFSHSALG